jgi:hypothetical protein
MTHVQSSKQQLVLAGIFQLEPIGCSVFSLQSSVFTVLLDQAIRQRHQYKKTKPVCSIIGERRMPHPNGQPGFIRIDSVHQGDQDGVKGVYHINAVDEVTQFGYASQALIFCFTEKLIRALTEFLGCRTAQSVMTHVQSSKQQLVLAGIFQLEPIGCSVFSLQSSVFTVLLDQAFYRQRPILGNGISIKKPNLYAQ